MFAAGIEPVKPQQAKKGGFTALNDFIHNTSTQIDFLFHLCSAMV